MEPVVSFAGIVIERAWCALGELDEARVRRG
jgi:hypothetical protein